MAGRRTNLALLALLGAAILTGALSFAIGSGWGRWAVIAHGAAGLGVLLLAPWKSIVARRGLRRRRPGSMTSLVFAGLVAVALLAGIAHGTGTLRTAGGVTAMQVHVAAALAAVPFAVWHVLARRVRPRLTDLSRRNLLRSAGLLAAAVGGYGVVAGVVGAAGLPGRARRFTGSYERGSFEPSSMPVTQWLDDSVPAIDAADWRLVIAVDGDVSTVVSLGDVEAMRAPVRAVLDCTGGWFAEQVWEGVPVARLLPASVRGRSVLVRSVTGYTRRFPFGDVDALWLVTRAGGEPLSAGHGFPARIAAPGRRGFWWVKWVTSVEVSDAPWWWQPPFPLT